MTEPNPNVLSEIGGAYRRVKAELDAAAAGPWIPIESDDRPERDSTILFFYDLGDGLSSISTTYAGAHVDHWDEITKGGRVKKWARVRSPA